jgi:quercetin dioxygenase-like cupin family protein
VCKHKASRTIDGRRGAERTGCAPRRRGGNECAYRETGEEEVRLQVPQHVRGEVVVHSPFQRVGTHVARRTEGTEAVMRRVISSIAVVLFLLVAGLVLAQPRAAGPGHHLVTLPTAVQGSASVETRVLLETAHLKIATVSVRRGAVMAEHAAPTQVSIQALAGSGEIRLAGTTERIDPAHMLVLAPGVGHEIRATGGDLVLLVHHVLLPGPRGRGLGWGR